MSTIYSELSILFKLAQEINEIIERENKEDDEEKKELAEEFILHTINILNITNRTDDEIFIRDNFINNNINIISWLKQNNFIDERTNSLFENLKANYNNENNINKIILEREDINKKQIIDNDKEKENKNKLDDIEMYFFMRKPKLII